MTSPCVAASSPAGSDAGGCWSVYLIRRVDGALYAGATTDVVRRFGEHSAGGRTAARSLRGRGPLRLVWTITVANRSQALRVEAALKALSRAGKEAVVAGSRMAPGLGACKE